MGKFGASLSKVAQLSLKRTAWSRRDNAFSLVEVMISFFVSTIIISLMMRFLLTTYMSLTIVAGREEGLAMLDNARRVILEDVHASTKQTIHNGALQLQFQNGVQYVYTLSRNHQLIRTRLGGGTAVLAIHLASVSFVIEPLMVRIHMALDSGEAEDDAFATLSGVRDLS